jgi:ankyrin repeat protein
MGNVPTVDMWGDIFTLIERGATEQVAEQARRDPALVHARRDDGATPLHVAAAGGHTEMISVLLAHGADIDARDNLGHSPVSLAARFIHGTGAGGWADHAGVTAFLLDHGAALDVWAATILDRADALDALLRADPALVDAREPVGTPMGMGLTPLHHAAERGHLAATRVLLAHGADVRATDHRGRPPLYLAAQRVRFRKMRPSPDVVDLLLAHGAPLDIFAGAVLGRTDHVAKLLSNDPAQVNARDAGGYTPLHLPAWNGKRDTATLLLDAGADINARNGRGETPLALAALYENEDGMGAMIDLLLDRGATADIFTAARLGFVAGVAARLHEDPDRAHAHNRYERTPMQCAVEKALWIPLGTRWGRHWDVVDLLVAHGARVETSIWTACALGQNEDVAGLLRGDPRLANASGLSALTPLHWAAYHGHAAVVDLLLAYGADTEATDPYLGKTPLQWARDAGHGAIVARLQRHDNAAN